MQAKLTLQAPPTPFAFEMFEKVCMKKALKQFLTVGCALLAATAVLAKLPALSDEAKAKAAEEAAKAAWSGKVGAYLSCKSQDKVAAYYYKAAKAANKDVKPATLDGVF